MGIDVGRTFTDLLLMDEKGDGEIYKISSTPADPPIGVVNGLGQLDLTKKLRLDEFFPD